ncbi:MAG: amidase family protein [Burkholderiaceae bacterium]
MNPYASLIEQRDALRAGTLSAGEWLAAQIARIEALDAPLNAVVVRDFERARAAAAESDRRIAAGTARALEGVPVTIKEGINVVGLVTSVGDASYTSYVSAYDARSVARLRAAGAVIVGKSNLPVEMADWQSANPVYGRTNNPYDTTRTCGGSSGGGAVVAAGFAALDLGSDIGGSVRVPAAFCGLYGLRPSETAVPRSGQYPFPPTPNWGAVLGAQGPLARSAADIALALSVMCGPDVGEDVAWRLQLPPARRDTLAGARIAVLEPPDWAPVDPQLLAARDRVIGALGRAGATVARAQPEGFDDWREHMRLYLRLLHYMMSPRWDADKRERAVRELRRCDDEFAPAQIEGLTCTGAQLFMWHLARERVRAAWRAFFTQWDAMLTPAFHLPAFEHIAFDGPALGVAATHTRLMVDGRSVPYARGLFFPHTSTLAGQPALSCPVGLSPEGLPLAVQLIGPYLEDATIIRFGELLAREIGGFVPPPIPA